MATASVSGDMDTLYEPPNLGKPVKPLCTVV
jgi:hypothetical protein